MVRCHVLQPCPVGPLGADGAVLVGPDSVLGVAAEGEALTWPGWGRLKLCLHLGLLLSWLDLLLLLLLLLLFSAADLLGRSLHLLLLHLLMLLHWQWGEEHLLHLAHWKTAAHWGAQAQRLSWGELGQLLGQRLRKTRESTRNEDVRSAHNETASTHNKSVARATETVVRATETVVRTASTCGCMLHGVVDGCCSHGCTTACGGGCGVPLLLWPLQQLLAVLQEADTPSPRAAWARGLH